MSAREDLKKLVTLIGLDGQLERNPLLEDEEVLSLLCLIESTRYLNRRTTSFKTLHWWENIFNCKNDAVFRNHFRMTQDSFFKLAAILKDHPSINATQDPISLQLAVCLWRLGNFGTGCGVKQVAIKFSISVGSVVNFTDRVIDALTSLSKTWIQWPNATERQTIGNEMAAKLLPKCVGFVDGTDAILNDAPMESKEVYWSRKKKYCLQVQIICDHKKVVRDLFVGYPGSVHDAKVFTSSPIGSRPSKFFSDGEYIIGDSAYPLSDTVIVPYRNSAAGLPREKRTFNHHISTHRVAVEHTIGILKSRFQSLKGIRTRVNLKEGHAKVCDWMLTCVTLHNMLMQYDPWAEWEPEPENEEHFEGGGDEQVPGGNLKREALYELFKNFN